MLADNFVDELLRRYAVKLLTNAGLLFLCAGLSEVLFAAPNAPEDPKKSHPDSTIIKRTTGPEDDGWYDMSSWLDQPYGFLPMLSPVTEPAVGYGVWGGPTFIGKSEGEEKAGWGRPNITFVGGAWTENGTWAGMGEDQRQWLNERLQTQADVIYGSVNLKFYGIGEDALLKNNPIDYTLTPLALVAKAKYRIGKSNFWVGLGYSWIKTVNEIDIPDQFTQLHDIRRDSKAGMLLPLLNYDSRDNVFTPLSGTNVQLNARLASKTLGGDGTFQTVFLTAMQFVTPLPLLSLALRMDGIMSFGDVPFYLYPSMNLRGAPAMRYQGEDIAQGEFEARWQFWKRLSLVGFCGYGAAWNKLEFFENTTTVFTKGVGCRYELARKYGLHAGVDVAWAPDGAAFYIVFGSAWMWK
jgi:hypothetical protein